MNILIIFYSYSGNTKKVAELLKEKISKENVKLRSALTVKKEVIEKSDILVIGSPIHGHIFFGQQFCKEIRQVITEKLPNNLERKKIILFATYLFSPRNALQKNKTLLESRNGEVIGLVAEKRNRKEELVTKLGEIINS